MLSNAGLNLQAVFNIDDLPDDITKPLQDHCDGLSSFTQLLLIGHGGRSLWENVKQSWLSSSNPINEYTMDTIHQYFAKELPGHELKFVYPSSIPIGLRALGELAGWHHDSPFRVGVNAEWGPWFAYRAVVLSNTSFIPTQANKTVSPCDTCQDKICLSKCPGDALEGGSLVLNTCLDYRKQEGSLCQDKCLSRMSCPVGSAHRYTNEQINFHYGRSMDVIRNWKPA